MNKYTFASYGSLSFKRTTKKKTAFRQETTMLSALKTFLCWKSFPLLALETPSPKHYTSLIADNLFTDFLPPQMFVRTFGNFLTNQNGARSV